MFIGTQCDLWGKPDGTGHEKNKSRELPGGRKTVKSKNGENLVFSRGGVTLVTPFSFSSAHSEE